MKDQIFWTQKKNCYRSKKNVVSSCIHSVWYVNFHEEQKLFLKPSGRRQKFLFSLWKAKTRFINSFILKKITNRTRNSENRIYMKHVKWPSLFLTCQHNKLRHKTGTENIQINFKKKRYRTQEMQNVNNMMAKIILQKSKLTGFKFSQGKTIK